jgi:three-Cys-motif partner protein
MAKMDTVWPLDVHTLGKHIVLRKYMNAWLPILGTWSGRILFIDGFAGPGEYENGEEGSPVIALKALLEHTAKSKIKAEVVYVFIESDPKRAEHLEEVIRPLIERLPSNVQVEVSCGACAPTLSEILDRLDSAGNALAPAFVMLDPFGVKDTPLTIIARLLRQSQCELFISFMWESINRFMSTLEFEAHLDGLFGTSEWRRALQINDTDERKQFIHELYKSQLRAAGARYVTHFELWREGKHVYSIFFATKHSKGFDKMKEAIWRADRTGSYQFRGSRGEQMALQIDEVDVTPFTHQIASEFTGRDWVSVDEIEEWARTDATSYYSGQVRRALRSMEASGRIEVDESTRKRARSHPSGTKMRFV